jgi:hypothetical protein
MGLSAYQFVACASATSAVPKLNPGSTTFRNGTSLDDAGMSTVVDMVRRHCLGVAK